MRIPRKLKKKLKAAVLVGKDPRWKTSEVRIDSVRVIRPERRDLVPTYGNLSVTGYRLT